MRRRYRLSGTVKFYDDQLSLESLESAEAVLNGVQVEIDGCSVMGGVKLIEKKIEDLGPAEEDREDFYPSAEPPEDW